MTNPFKHKSHPILIGLGSVLPPTAFLSGSRAIRSGCEFDTLCDSPGTSDWDIAVSISDRDSFRESIGIVKKWDKSYSERGASSYNAGEKFSFLPGGLDLDVLEINLVWLHPLDLVCWWHTTTHARELFKEHNKARELMADRTSKLGLFEAFTGIHKMCVGYEGSDATLELLAAIQSKSNHRDLLIHNHQDTK